MGSLGCMLEADQGSGKQLIVRGGVRVRREHGLVHCNGSVCPSVLARGHVPSTVRPHPRFKVCYWERMADVQHSHDEALSFVHILSVPPKQTQKVHGIPR